GLGPGWGVAVDVLVVGAGDGGGLAGQEFGFAVVQGWAVRDVPGGGGEVVAVALGEVVVGFPLSPGFSPLSPAHYSPLRCSPFGPAFGCSALRLSHEGRGSRSVLF